MAATTSAVQPLKPNRRRRVRHKIQTPAYATFSSDSQTPNLDLYEIIDISEEGISIHCPSTLETNQQVSLCLDLAECPEQILTTGTVIWSNPAGRAGLHFLELPPTSLFRLREWLFLNAMAGVANADQALMAGALAQQVPPRPSYTDALAAVTAVQREVESLLPDLNAALQLIATRTQVLVRASGAAIALASDTPEFMECRASAGNDAPPTGARLQVGSGFSGECVKTGHALRCDDTELDSRVDRESCHALGIRSILAVPVRVGAESIGILETFSSQPNVFSDSDSRVLQRLGETVLFAVNRASRPESQTTSSTQSAPQSFTPSPGSVLFASTENGEPKEASNQKQGHGISLPRAHLILLLCFAATIAGVLGYISAPLLQSKLEQHRNSEPQTVLASTKAPRIEATATPTLAALENMSVDQLRPLAAAGNAAAENFIGLRYFQGSLKDRVPQDEREAAHWFIAAAEHGDVAGQSKLGFLYWSGRGVAKDVNRAYLWTLIACSHENDATKDPAVFLSKDLARVLRNQMTRDQAAAIEHQAKMWLQVHSEKMLASKN